MCVQMMYRICFELLIIIYCTGDQQLAFGYMVQPVFVFLHVVCCKKNNYTAP